MGQMCAGNRSEGSVYAHNKKQQPEALFPVDDIFGKNGSNIGVVPPTGPPNGEGAEFKIYEHFRGSPLLRQRSRPKRQFRKEVDQNDSSGRQRSGPKRHFRHLN